MSRLSLTLCVIAACVALAAAAAHADGGLTRSSRISEFGVGPVKVGMTRDEAEEAAGLRLRLSTAFGSCRQGSFVGGPRNHAVLLTDGVIRRVEAYRGYQDGGWTGSPLRTTRGVGIGSRERAVFRKYGRVSRRRHEYVAGGEYLTFRPRRNPGRRIVFETDARNRITHIRAGRRPEVGYIEGCA